MAYYTGRIPGSKNRTPSKKELVDRVKFLEKSLNIHDYHERLEYRNDYLKKFGFLKTWLFSYEKKNL